MKLLLDECIDWRLAASFPDSFEMHTVRGAGWSGTKNGALLQRAADAGFDAIVTVDKNIEFQQNLNTLPITVDAAMPRSRTHPGRVLEAAGFALHFASI